MYNRTYTFICISRLETHAELIKVSCQQRDSCHMVSSSQNDLGGEKYFQGLIVCLKLYFVADFTSSVFFCLMFILSGLFCCKFHVVGVVSLYFCCSWCYWFMSLVLLGRCSSATTVVVVVPVISYRKWWHYRCCCCHCCVKFAIVVITARFPLRDERQFPPRALSSSSSSSSLLVRVIVIVVADGFVVILCRCHRLSLSSLLLMA